MLGTLGSVVDSVLYKLSVSCSRSQRVLSNTHPRLLGGTKDEGTDEAGTVTDSVAPL